MSSSYLGIDVGTSSVKLLWMRADGKTLQETTVAYAYETPQQGWTEIQPEVWWQAVVQGLRTLLQDATAAQRQSIAAIGTTGQMHTTVFLDAKGRSIRPAIMWNDVRSLPLLASVQAQIEGRDEFKSIAAILSTGSPAMNICWLQKQEPENYARLRKFLIGPDYIVYRLTGSMGTDYCEASTSSLYDLEQQKWSEPMRKLLGLPVSIYPEIHGSAEVVGCLQKDLARELDLPATVKVIAGTGDNAAAAYANGIGTRQKVLLSLGTSGVLVAAYPQVDFSRCGKHILFSLDGKKVQVLVQGVVQSVGRTMNWWMKEILQEDDFNAEVKDFDRSQLGTSKLLFYPHIMGDKNLYHDMSLRGGFFGIGVEDKRQDFQVAIMEGIAMAFRQLMEKMGLDRGELGAMPVTGGGAKSDIWLQILADVLDLPVIRLQSNASAVYGAAKMAQGEQPAAQAEIAKSQQVFRPQQRNVLLYKKKYQQYQQIYQALQMIYAA